MYNEVLKCYNAFWENKQIFDKDIFEKIIKRINNEKPLCLYNIHENKEVLSSFSNVKKSGIINHLTPDNSIILFHTSLNFFKFNDDKTLKLDTFLSVSYLYPFNAYKVEHKNNSNIRYINTRKYRNANRMREGVSYLYEIKIPYGIPYFDVNNQTDKELLLFPGTIIKLERRKDISNILIRDCLEDYNIKTCTIINFDYNYYIPISYTYNFNNELSSIISQLKLKKTVQNTTRNSSNNNIVLYNPTFYELNNTFIPHFLNEKSEYNYFRLSCYINEIVCSLIYKYFDCEIVDKKLSLLNDEIYINYVKSTDIDDPKLLQNDFILHCITSNLNIFKNNLAVNYDNVVIKNYKIKNGIIFYINFTNTLAINNTNRINRNFLYSYLQYISLKNIFEQNNIEIKKLYIIYSFHKIKSKIKTIPNDNLYQDLRIFIIKNFNENYYNSLPLTLKNLIDILISKIVDRTNYYIKNQNTIINELFPI